jgi:hypothetical protein
VSQLFDAKFLHGNNLLEIALDLNNKRFFNNTPHVSSKDLNQINHHSALLNVHIDLEKHEFSFNSSLSRKIYHLLLNVHEIFT